DALLECEAARILASDTSEFRESEHLSMLRGAHDADPNVAVKRKHVMLAERDERNRPFDELLELVLSALMAFGREFRADLRIFFVAAGDIDERPQPSARRIFCSWRILLKAGAMEDLAHPAFVLLHLFGRERFANVSVNFDFIHGVMI